MVTVVFPNKWYYCSCAHLKQLHEAIMLCEHALLHGVQNSSCGFRNHIHPFRNYGGSVCPGKIDIQSLCAPQCGYSEMVSRDCDISSCMRNVILFIWLSYSTLMMSAPHVNAVLLSKNLSSMFILCFCYYFMFVLLFYVCVMEFV